MAKVMLSNVRLSFVRLDEAKQFNGQGDYNYSCVALIEKGSKAHEAIISAEKELEKEYLAKNPKYKGVLPKYFQSIIRDGVEEGKEGNEHIGHVYINLKRKEKDGRPLMISRSKQVIEHSAFYSGCYANVSLNTSLYDMPGKAGVSGWLNAVQKFADGERLDGGGATTDDFEEFDDEDFMNTQF